MTYQQFQHVCLWQATWLLSASFFPTFSLVFPAYLPYQVKPVSLLTIGTHSIQRGIPHQLVDWFF
ncbi:hypothetical protein ACRRTK_009998 [Alexandromys fortis]